MSLVVARTSRRDLRRRLVDAADPVAEDVSATTPEFMAARAPVDTFADVPAEPLVDAPAVERVTPSSGFDIFEQASRVFCASATPKRSSSAPAAASLDTVVRAEAAVPHVAPRRSRLRKIGATVGVMSLAVLFAVSMTLPAETVPAVQGAQVLSAASVVASSPVQQGEGESEIQAQAFVTSSDVQKESLARTADFSTVSLVDLASERGTGYHSGLFKTPYIDHIIDGQVITNHNSAVPGRVVVIGDMLIDEIRDAGAVRELVGGAALNVAVGSRRPGAPTALVAMVGEDQAGDHIRQYLGNYEVRLTPSEAPHGSSRVKHSVGGGPEYEFNEEARRRSILSTDAVQAIVDADLVVIGCFPFDVPAEVDALVEALGGARTAIDPNPRSRGCSAIARSSSTASDRLVGADGAAVLYDGDLDALRARLRSLGAGAGGVVVETDAGAVAVPISAFPGLHRDSRPRRHEDPISTSG